MELEISSQGEALPLPIFLLVDGHGLPESGNGKEGENTVFDLPNWHSPDEYWQRDEELVPEKSQRKWIGFEMDRSYSNPLFVQVRGIRRINQQSDLRRWVIEVAYIQVWPEKKP